MKFEIVMTNNITIVHDVSGMELDEFVNVLGRGKSKSFIMLKTNNDTDIAINPDMVISVRKSK